MLDFIEKNAKETKKRFSKYYEEGDFVLGFITDVHTYGNEHYKHIADFFSLAKDFNVDVFVNGGDIGLDIEEDKQECEEIINNTFYAMNSTVPVLFCKGNHDFGKQKVKNGEIIDRLCVPFANKFSNEITLVKNGNLGGYGFYKNEKKKTEVVFLNTTEGETNSFVMSDSQIKWFIETLENIEENYKVIVVSHVCFDDIGLWLNSTFTLPKKFDIIKEILKDFANGKSGKKTFENIGFSWNFTKNSNKLICALSGDSHFDNFIKRNNVNFVVRQGYGGILDENVYYGGTHRRFSANEDIKKVENCLFDILCVKPSGESKMFRIGVGDINADLEF